MQITARTTAIQCSWIRPADGSTKKNELELNLVRAGNNQGEMETSPIRLVKATKKETNGKRQALVSTVEKWDIT